MELRRRLQQIVDSMPVFNQELAITELASTFSHSLLRLRDAQAEKWNCFAFAFNLGTSRAYEQIAWADRRGCNTFFASPRFVQFVIQKESVSEISEGEAQPGDVVIYLDDDRAHKHAGKITPNHGRVKSKWGVGHFWEHGLWEVPEKYGNTVRFFRDIPEATAEREFLEFAKLQPGFEKFVEKHDLRRFF